MSLNKEGPDIAESLRKTFNMASNNFILTAEAHSEALPNFHFSTQAVHADDFVSPHRAIAPAMHSAVNYRYARNPDDLVEMENDDVLILLIFTQKSLTFIAKCPIRLTRILSLYSPQLQQT